jgi:phage terminase large subunit
MVPVKASGWLNTELSEEEREALISAGLVPINDVFFDLWANTNPINLLYGGYGSGKSLLIAAELLRCCRESKYFRCYFGRKILEDVRGSVHATLCDVIEDLKMEAYFKYSRQPNGSMVIRCENGNTFLPFGASNPKSLKSIKDPTHFFCEELDQFEQKDFELIYPRLRTTKAITQFYGAFNTTEVYDTHWLRKIFFPETLQPNQRLDLDILEGQDITKVFANYTENYFIDREGYLKKLRLASGGQTHVLKAIAEGAWGVINNTNPWLYAFNFKRHVSLDRLEALPDQPIHLSFDFNINPMTCIAFQHTKYYGKGSYIRILKEFEMNNTTVKEACKQIKAAFPYSVLTATGDATGRNRNAGYATGSDTLWAQVQQGLKLSSSQILVPSINPSHRNSRFLCNYLLQEHEGFLIDPSCKGLINDMLTARPIETDDQAKEDKLLKGAGDSEIGFNLLDCFRYAMHTHHSTFVKSPLK